MVLAIGIQNKNYKNYKNCNYIGQVLINGTEVNLCSYEVEEPYFDENENKNYLLVRVDALSCNYRDKALIVKSSLRFENSSSESLGPAAWFGSDFVATVIKKGKNVKRFDIGDSVIPNCCYPLTPSGEIAPGVTTNEASRRFLILHSDKLSKIPLSMSKITACGYSIGAQTSRSLVRRTVSSLEDRVLVLSSRSNTSQFALLELERRGISAVAASTSNWTDLEKEKMSFHKLVKINRSEDWWKIFQENSFDVVIDPYFDLHIQGALKILDYYGRYITCGFKNQHPSFSDPSDFAVNSHQIIVMAMIKNISIMGNCIGTFEDLEDSLSNYSQDKHTILVDSVYTSDRSVEFIDRTYNKKERLGKAVLMFND